MAGACPFTGESLGAASGQLGTPSPVDATLPLGHLARQSWAWLLSTHTGKGGKGGGEGSEGVEQGVVGSSIKSRKGNPLVWAWVPSDSHIGETPRDPGPAMTPLSLVCF